MNLESMNFLDLSHVGLGYDKWSLMNLFLLLIPWVAFMISGHLKKNFAYLLLGLGLFSLFIKEWLAVNFGYTHLNFTQVIFWECFFLFVFFWLITKIYHECVIRGNDYLFPSLSSDQTPPRTFLGILFPSTHFFSPFTLWGGAIWVLALLSLLNWITSEAIQAIVSGAFFLIIVFDLEKKFYYWTKDYVYLGSSWTHSKVIRFFKLFYGIYSLGFIFMMIAGIMNFFGIDNFSKNISTILSVFALIKTLAVITLYGFFYRLLNFHSQIQEAFQTVSANTKEWLEQIFSNNGRFITSQELKTKYPHLLFSDIDDGYSSVLIRYLAELLKNTKSEWIYLYEPGYPDPQKRVIFNPPTDEMAPSSLDNGLEKLDPETYLPGVQKLLEKPQEVFFYHIYNRSFALKKALKDYFPLSLGQDIQSLIVYPFPRQNKICSLLLGNSEFAESPFRAFQKYILSQFTHRLSHIHFTAEDESGILSELVASVDSPPKPIEPIEQTEPMEITKKDKAIEVPPSTEYQTAEEAQPEDTPSSPSPQTAEEVQPEDTPSSPSSPSLQTAEETQPEDTPVSLQASNLTTSTEVAGKPKAKASPKKKTSHKSLFPDTQNKNKMIIETNLEKTYIKNTDKVVHTFHPSGHRARRRAGNRQSDRITYKVIELYTDQIQNALVLASNIGRKGKLFVFNEFEQDHSLHAATNLNLLNLFYTYLPEKKVTVFSEEWQRGWKPFSSKDICQFLAMEFHPDNHQLTYFNAGVTHAYIFDKKQGIFSPLIPQQTQLIPTSEKKPFDSIETTQVQMSPNHFIVIFSKGLTEVKNSQGEKIDMEEFFKIIRKKSQSNLDDILHSLEKKIKDFAYSMIENQQLIFMAKILK